jgi:hypothetical protein
MTMATLSHVTGCGWTAIDRVSFVVRACHVYGSREQVVASPALPQSFEEQIWSRL